MMADHLMHATTICTRFSVTRRQGDGGGVKLMDMGTHYSRLVPIICTTYALKVFSSRLHSTWLGLVPKLSEETFPRSTQAMIGEVHSSSSGVKAWFGWYGADALEVCRRLMGGHSYSAYSFIPQAMASFGVLTQGGGPGATLAQQSAKYVVGHLHMILQSKIKEPKDAGPSVRYLFDTQLEDFSSFQLCEGDIIGDTVESISNLYKALRRLACFSAQYALLEMSTNMSEADSPTMAWEMVSVSLGGIGCFLCPPSTCGCRATLCILSVTCL